MVNLLNGNVMTALMSASTHADLSGLCTGIYQAARARGDEEAAQQAMGYANSYREKSLTASQQVQEAMVQSVEEVREVERHEQRQRIAVSGTANSGEAGAPRVPEAGAAPAVSRAPQPAATLALSGDYLNSVQAAESGSVEPAGAAAHPVKAPAEAAVAHAPHTPDATPSKTAGAAGRRGLSMDIRV